LRPAGEFNESRAVVNRNRIEHWLNGVRVVVADVSSAALREVAAKAPGRTQRALEEAGDERNFIKLKGVQMRV
jgi:hypothetical protein